MALSFLRTKVINHHVKNQLIFSKRNAGYLVLIPEIGEDADTSQLVSENGLPDFNDLSIEKCIALVTKQSSDYEMGVKKVEKMAANSKDAFKEVFQPLEKLDSSLELTWGMSKTLYLGNSSMMPTKSYMQIHARAQKARSSKYNSMPIFSAAVEEKNRSKNVTDEEQRLVDKYILEGKLNGLEVGGMAEERLNYILGEMQKERGQFRDKVNAATKMFNSTINNELIVRDFPESLLQAISTTSSPLKGPWKVTLQPHVYEQFMTHCPVRDLRFMTWKAHTERCSAYSDKQFETSVNLEKIRHLRLEQAKILGFENYAEMSMETKMAKKIENVYSVLDSLLDVARPIQDEEIDSLQAFALESGFDYKLDYADIPYFQRKQKISLYNFDENKLREYFPLPKVINSIFNICNTLFKIQIVERSNVQTWHKDVKFYDVFEDSSSNPIAGFYFDPYARQDLKIRVHNDDGWHAAIQNRSTFTSTIPLSALIFNFLPPSNNTPSLLSFNDVEILFQRFGHALRHLLTKANYSAVAGVNNVEWDSADICGHFFINWLYDPQTLKSISSHHSTNEPLPNDVIQNIQNVRSHMAGYHLCKELYLSRLDLELHSTKTFWRDLMKQMWPKYHSLPFYKQESHILTFTKIFSDEWGAAYYSQVWSRMIAADIYSAFEEAKKTDKDITEVGKRYKDTFLALGGSCHPSEVFRRFRGRDPSPHALLNNLGLKKNVD